MLAGSSVMSLCCRSRLVSPVQLQNSSGMTSMWFWPRSNTCRLVSVPVVRGQGRGGVGGRGRREGREGRERERGEGEGEGEKGGRGREREGRERREGREV